MFLRDALNKAGIEAQFIAKGEYKSAANVFTEDGFTEAHREAVTRMLESLQEQVWQAVAKSRNLDVAVLDELADRAPLLRDDAVSSGLVDRIGFRDEAYFRIAELTGAKIFHRSRSTPTTSCREYLWRATPVQPDLGWRRRCRRCPGASPSRRSRSSPSKVRSSTGEVGRKVYRSAPRTPVVTPLPLPYAR